MATTTIDLKIGKKVDEKTNEVVLFIEDANWGPVISGKNLEEAKLKFKKALHYTMLANTLFHSMYDQNNSGKESTKPSITTSMVSNLQNQVERLTAA